MAQPTEINDPWDWEVSSAHSRHHWSLRELWAYRHLLGSLIRRDFLVNYQQTILGPVWIILQPVLTLIVFVLVFSHWMRVDTGTSPPVLFFLCGIILWNLFNDLFTGSAFIFSQYNYLYSKVYFPRLIIHLSVAGTHLLRFLIQCVFLVMTILYYVLFRDFSPGLHWQLLILPVFILLVVLFALALGLSFSILTARYRDLTNIVYLGVRLFMFVTPVIYPLSVIPENIRWVANINPLSPLFEAFRYALLGDGLFTTAQLFYSSIFIIGFFLLSVVWFNKQAGRLIDVV